MNYKEAQTYFSSKELEALNVIIEHEIANHIRLRWDGGTFTVLYAGPNGMVKVADWTPSRR